MHELDWARGRGRVAPTTTKGLPVKLTKKCWLAVALVIGALLTMLTAPAATAQTNSWLSAHIQDLGWVDAHPSVSHEGATTVGTTGQSKRIEAIRLNSPIETGFTVKAHVQNIGWVDGKADSLGRLVIGTTGKSLRIEALKFEKRYPENSEVFCQVHVQNIGWMKPVKSGEICGTTGKSLRVEAIRVWFE